MWFSSFLLVSLSSGEASPPPIGMDPDCGIPYFSARVVNMGHGVHNLWRSHFGVDEFIQLPPILMFARGFLGFDQGCGIKGFLSTSVIQGDPTFYEHNSLWKALSVVSQKWSFPTALVLTHR